MEPLAKREGDQSVHKVKGYCDFYDSKLDYPRLETAESENVTKDKGKWQNPEELFKQLKVDEIEISDVHKTKLKELLSEFMHVFARDNYDMGLASFFEAKIELKNDYVAKYVPHRPIPYKMREQMDDQINNLLNSGQIEPCHYSKWNSCIFLVGSLIEWFRI